MTSRFVPELAVPPRPVPGVNIAGFFEGELGLGEVARKLGTALEHAGVPVAAIPYRRHPSRQQHRPELELSAEAPYDTNVVCLNADYLHTFLDAVGAEFFAERYSIGVWFWETSVFPEGSDGERFLDEIWVASEYVRGAISEKVSIPVYVAPLPIETPAIAQRSRSDVGLPDAYTFLFTFDFVSARRKNPTAVIDAFTRAFQPGEGPVLVLKSVNGADRKPELLAELHGAIDGRPDIRIRDGYVSRETTNAITSLCDCYVSLHRSEGFGLTMAEAMSHGKPVIATGYSGNLDFMSEDNSYLVPFRLVPVPGDWWAHVSGAEWAEPDVDAAAVLMRHVYEDRAEASVRAARARAEILERFSLERTASAIAQRLDAARELGSVEARGAPHDARPPILEASQELARGIGDSLTRSRGSPPTSLLRRLLYRALWPYLEDQQRLQTAVLDALTMLQRSVDDLEQRVLRLETSAGAEDERFESLERKSR